MTDHNYSRGMPSARTRITVNPADYQDNPEILARYRAAAEARHDQDQINRAIAAYEEARMGHRPKPNFELHLINHDHFYAKRRLPAGLVDLLAVIAGGSLWFLALFGLWIVFA